MKSSNNFRRTTPLLRVISISFALLGILISFFGAIILRQQNLMSSFKNPTDGISQLLAGIAFFFIFIGIAQLVIGKYLYEGEKWARILTGIITGSIGTLTLIGLAKWITNGEVMKLFYPSDIVLLTYTLLFILLIIDEVKWIYKA